MTEQKIISQNLRKLREKFAWKQDDIARYLGVQREVISYYETGQRDIPYENLEKLAIWYGVDIADLFEENLELQTTLVAFAFRAEEILDGDLQELAAFKKIVTNYLKMSKLKNEHRI